MSPNDRVCLYRKQVAYLKGLLANLPSGSIAAGRVEEGLANARIGLGRATLEAIRDDNRGAKA